MIDQHHVDRLRRLGDVEDRVCHPIYAGHVIGVEFDFLPQGAAYALDDVALDGVLEPVGVDDLAAVVGDRELARPDFPAAAIHLDFGNDGDTRAAALRVGDAAAADDTAGLILARRGLRLPSGFFRRGLDPRDVPGRLDVPQPELDRVEAEYRRHVVHQRFAREMDLRSD